MADLIPIHPGNWDALNDTLGAFLVNSGDYAITTFGGTTVAIGTGANPLLTGSDPAAVLQQAITQLGTGGGTIMLVGPMTWGSVPTLPRNLTGRLHIRGIGTTVVTLTTAARRFMDFGKVGDYDTFTNWEISDLTIDVNNVGGQHHVVIGTYIGGGQVSKINVTNFAIRRVKTINVPVDSTLTNHRLNVWIFPAQATAGDNPLTITGGVVEDCDFQGGNMGCVLGGNNLGGATNCTTVLDDVHITRLKHSLLAAQTAGFSSSNIQLFSHARNGPKGCTVTDCYGEFSGDVGIEIDQPGVVVTGSKMRDAFNAGFFETRFNTPTYPGVSKYVACHSHMESVNALSYSFRSGTGTPPLDRIQMQNCSAYRNRAGIGTTGWAILRTDGTPTGTFHTQLDVDGFTVIEENINYASASTATSTPVSIGTSSGASNIINLRRLRFRFSGQSTGGAFVVYVPVSVFGVKLDFTLEDLVVNYNGWTGLNITPFSGARALHFGVDGVTTLVGSASIKGVRVTDFADCTAPICINMNSANLTIAAGQQVAVEDCDFGLAGSGAFDVLPSVTNRPKTMFRNIVWKSGQYPKPSAAMSANNFAAATFTTAVGNQYTGGLPAEIHFQTGTGAAITAIATSKDGSTYEQVYAQASAAMAQDVLVPVDNGDFVKVTFATTQPTTRVRFRR